MQAATHAQVLEHVVGAVGACKLQVQNTRASARFNTHAQRYCSGREYACEIDSQTHAETQAEAHTWSVTLCKKHWNQGSAWSFMQYPIMPTHVCSLLYVSFLEHR